MPKKNICKRGWSDYARLDLHSECLCQRDLSGRVAIVTGANSGIGYEVCAGLADKGAEVIMACRNEGRAEEALAKLKADNPERNLVIELIDVGNMQSVRDFAERIDEKYGVVDILVNNAGVGVDAAVTVEGFEIHFATNHLGHFLLTNLLMPKLKRSKDARVINVSSAAHMLGRYSPKTFRKPLGPMVLAYCNSKLCNVLFTKELGRRLAGTNVSVFAINPGMVQTNFPRSYQRKLRGRIVTAGLHRLGRPFLKTSKQGAQTVLHAAFNEDLPAHSGAYLDECAVASSSAASRDIDKARDLWQLSAEYTRLTDEANVALC